jgi:hypothetical protein
MLAAALVPFPISAQESTGSTPSLAIPSAAGSSEGVTERRNSNAPVDRSMEAVRANDDRPHIDGRLKEAVWQRSAVAEGFVQFRPDPGAAPSEATEVRVLYTDEAVYVGARMFDSQPTSIIRRLARRDQSTVTDEFLVGFDSYFDRRTAFVFAVSVAGVQRDYLVFDDTDEDDSWDAVWESATHTDEDGWTAELRIPLSQLRFNRPTEEGAGSQWGVNFQRELARLDETSQWSPHPADGSRAVSAFGTLTGLEGIEPSRHLELRPYALLQGTRAPGDGDNPFFSKTDLGASFGGDLRYGITNNLTLNATINPDFGQVEADAAVVNLTAFETFFPEKRPFFQEGVDIFNFGIGLGDGDQEQLFYTRRIGRRPRGDGPSEAEFEDTPEATTILGAAKLSGKTSGGWSVGFLNALTGEETTRYRTPEGEFGDVPAEPLTNYAVGRAIKDFNDGESAIGVVATATNRGIDADGPLYFLPDAAYAGGVDFRHRFGEGNYEVSGYLLGSHVRGNPGAMEDLQTSSTHYYQRPDATHVEFDPERRSLSGSAANLEISKIGGGRWRWGFIGTARSPGFEVNDLGFQRRADEAIALGYVGYDQFEPGGPFRRWRLNANSWSGWSFGGERISTGGNVNGSFQLKNYWRGYAGINVETPALSPTALRGGPALRTPAEYSGWLGFGSDSRRTVRFGLNFNFGGDMETPSGRLSLSPSVTVQASSRMQISLRPGFSLRNSTWQYVTTTDSEVQAHYVFGQIEQKTASLTARLNYTFTPDLSLQVYAQPFVSAGSYDGFKEVDDPRAVAFEGRFRTFGEDEIFELDDGFGVDTTGDGEANFTFDDPDFNVKQFRSNVVLRWEYRPGSTFFVVWSQNRGSSTGDGSFELGRDFSGVFDTNPTNVLLVKFEHWLGF